MSAKPGFLRSTFAAGVLYLIPVVVLFAIIGKAMQIAHQISPPLMKGVEAIHLGRILTPQVVAVILLLAVCFAIGAFARTTLARRVGAQVDAKLGNIPGYSLYKSVGDELLGAESSDARKVVMVCMEGAWQLAMVVTELEDGMLAIYIPGVPQVRAGALYFVPPERVRPLAVSMKSATLVLRKNGAGARELLKGESLRGALSDLSV